MTTKSTTKTKLNVILVTAGIVLASPVAAETWRDVPVSTNNVFWGQQFEADTHPRTGPGALIGGAPPRILDCVHVTFPQCGGN
jgi:hypothetical protein